MKIFEKRNDRNLGTVSPEEQKLLHGKSVLVAGCGGLGGTVIEELTRIGVGMITAVDGDVFEESNLNRQVLSNELDLGRPKAVEAEEQMKVINSEVTVRPVVEFVKADNARQLVAGHEVVVDALDNISSRKILEAACEAEGIPLVHGAIAGWNGQVAVIMPGDRIIEMIYSGDEDKGSERETGNPAFTPAVVASMQAAEVIKLLLGREGVLKNRMLMVDLLNHCYETVDFGE